VKYKSWLILAASLVLASLLSGVGGTRAYYNDSEMSASNHFVAWVSSLWSQTTQNDFNTGILINTDTSASPGDVQLNTTTITLGNSDNDAGATTVENAVHSQIDSFAMVPCNGEIVSWTYYNAGTTSTGAVLEFLSGSNTSWTMMAKSNAVTITGTNTFNVSIPVQAGWQLGMYSGSGELKYDSTNGTLSGRAADTGDFNIGINKADFSQSTGHLALTATLQYYYSSGTLASQVLDTGANGAAWDALCRDETLPSGTNITFKVRASNTMFTKDAVTPAWVSVGSTSPVISGLPSGRYKQWQVTLTTTDTSNTPTLHGVRVYYH